MTFFFENTGLSKNGILETAASQYHQTCYRVIEFVKFNKLTHLLEDLYDLPY